MNIRKIASLSLAAALQVLPLSRVFVAATPATGSSFAIVSTWIAGMAALLGGVDAVSGASSISISPATATVGVPYSGAVVYSGAHAGDAKSWQLTQNWNGAQSGCNTTYQIAPGLWLTNAGTYITRIGGTPTTAGVFNFTLKIHSGTGCGGGDSDTRSASITISGGTATAPVITTQPLSRTVTAGGSASFSVTASGTAPLTYQWKKNGSNVSGGTSSSLTLNPVALGDAGSYTCAVSNSVGSATSSAATLTVNAAVVAPTITTPPASQTVMAGANVSFTVAASGTAPLSYQWRLNGANIASATSATLTLSAVTTGQSGGSYSCLVSNSAGSATSSAATLTVNAVVAPSITTPPASQTVTVGGNATFSVTATGTAPLSYQWRRNGTNVAGATSATLALTGVTTNQAGDYSAVVANSSGSVTSSVATLTVLVPPAITTPPASQTVTAGGNATFTVAATGTAPLSYQWRRNGVNVSGATSATLALAGVTTNQAGSYVVLVGNSAGSVTSSPALLTVTAAAVAPTITTQPVSQTVMAGANASFTVAASGTTPLSHQWRLNGANLTDATNATLTLTSVTMGQSGGSYSCVVSNSAGSATSGTATLTVNAVVAPSITTQPASQTVTAGGNATITVIATGTAPLRYQWQRNGANLAGATSSTLALTSVTTNQAGSYVVLVSNSAGSVTSSPAILTVTNSFSPDTIPPTIIFLQPLVRYVSTSAITLSGTAADDRGVANVEVQKGDGAFVFANGTTNWVATVALDPGTNTIRVKATDTSGNTSPITSSAIIYVVATPLTLTINGNGVVAPLTNGQLLDLGSTYSIKATANPGSAFNNWIVGGANSSSPTLIFTMSSNLTITANFLADGSSGLGGIYNGLFYPNTSEPSFEHSGFFTLNVTAKGTFTGKLLLADTTYPLKGEFDAARPATLKIQREPANALRVDLQLAVGSDRITGSVGDDSWQSELGGYRAASKNSVNSFSGRYTMLLPGEDNLGASPLGHGSATLTVDTRGRVVLKGVLADGSPLAQSVPVSANGHVPLFVRLPRGKGSTLGWLTKGSILGWMTLTDGATNDTPGSLWWTQRAGFPGLLYPAGFSINVQTLGSRYTPADNGKSSLSSAAVVLLDGGNLPSPSANEAYWSDPSHVSVVAPNPIGLTLTMSASTGLLKGRFVHPETGKPSAIRGVFLQKQNFGGGFFLGTDLSGAVMLEPAVNIP